MITAAPIKSNAYQSNARRRTKNEPTHTDSFYEKRYSLSRKRLKQQADSAKPNRPGQKLQTSNLMIKRSSTLIGLLLAVSAQLGLTPEATSQSILDSYKTKPVTIAVRRVKNMAGSFAENGVINGRMIGFWRPSFEIRLAEILSTELANTGNFTVLERQNLYEIIEEQNMANINTNTAVKKNNLNQARYIIIASLSDYVPNTSGTRKNTDGKVLIFGGSSDRTEVNTYVAFDLRVIDTSTGSIAYSRTIEGETKAISKTNKSRFDPGALLGLAVPGGVDLSIENAKTTFDTTTATRALRAAMIGTVEYLNCVLYLKDECIDEYRAMDEKRKADTLDSLNLF